MRSIFTCLALVLGLIPSAWADQAPRFTVGGSNQFASAFQGYTECDMLSVYLAHISEPYFGLNAQDVSARTTDAWALRANTLEILVGEKPVLVLQSSTFAELEVAAVEIRAMIAAKAKRGEKLNLDFMALLLTNSHVSNSPNLQCGITLRADQLKNLVQ